MNESTRNKLLNNRFCLYYCHKKLSDWFHSSFFFYLQIWWKSIIFTCKSWLQWSLHILTEPTLKINISKSINFSRMILISYFLYRIYTFFKYKTFKFFRKKIFYFFFFAPHHTKNLRNFQKIFFFFSKLIYFYNMQNSSK